MTSAEVQGSQTEPSACRDPSNHLQPLAIALQEAPHHPHHEACPRVRNVAGAPTVVLRQLGALDDLVTAQERATATEREERRCPSAS